MKLLSKRLNKAFTLSEVLLATAILGIVAAMTMPGFISSYKHKIYVIQLEKSLSQLEQAMQNIMVRHECTDIVCSQIFDGLTSDSAWNDKIDNEMKKSIKVLRSYKNGEAVSAGLISMYLKPRRAYTSSMDWSDREGYKFMTHDGVMYQIKTRDCEKPPFAEVAIIKNICADVTIDVNGARLPNQYGRDIFNFVVAQNGHLYALYGSEYALAMKGAEGLSSTEYWENSLDACASNKPLYQSSSNVSGLGCAARIIGMGWKMDY